MYLTRNLINEVFEIPYNEGYRNLQVLSGYVSPAFVDIILFRYEELILNITVGMVSKDGISVLHHQTFKNLLEKYPDRLDVTYQIRKPGNHRKVYWWLEEGLYGLPSKVFVGSANFSYNAFYNQSELLVEANYDNINEVFEDLETMNCTDLLIENNIKPYKLDPNKKQNIVTNYDLPIEEKWITTASSEEKEYVDISLLSGGVVPAKSGLNWGQRRGRNKNQAYLSVLLEIHNRLPSFFPKLKEPFLVVTDDGASFVCVMAQANRKAIHTMENNSLLGAYFRERLGLESGTFVTAEHLHRYGRTDVRIYKNDDETYYLDFSPL